MPRKSSKPALTAGNLFSYAREFSTDAAAEGRSIIYPTIKQAGQYFGVSMAAIEEVCQEYCDVGYLGLIVAFKSNGGYAQINRKKDRLIEAY